MDKTINRSYLPQSYEQYLIQKKKQNRSSIHKINQQSAMLSENHLQLTNNNNNNNKTSIKKQQKQQKEQQQNKFEQEQQKQIKQNKIIIIQKIINSEWKTKIDQFHTNKFKQIQQKILQEINKLKQQYLIKKLDINIILKNLEIQSLENIQFLIQQLNYIKGKRNMEKLDSMLCFNKFFIILNKCNNQEIFYFINVEKKYQIYDHCQLKQYQQGQKVYQQGEIDYYMYIIVKGSIKQVQQKVTSFNKKLSINFISYYQGANFGQSQLLGDAGRGKRYTSTYATEQSFLLRIENDFYKDLITNSVEDDLELKLNALMQSSIFKQTSKMFITPLFSILQKHILPYGKVLIRQEQKVNHLYFIAQGTLQIVLLDRIKRSVKHLNIEQKPRNLYLKSQKKKNKKNNNYSIHNTFYYPQHKQTDKQFLYGKKKIIGNQIQYNNFIIFNQLQIGDFFGGKSFLNQDQKQMKYQSSQFFTIQLQAKLSIISSSTKTIVYSIDEKKFFSLSDNLQKSIIQGILEMKYFDDENIDTKVKNDHQWNKYSSNLVQKIIQDKKKRGQSFRDK